MNAWRRGSLEHNPYVRTAFRVTRVTTETVRRAALIQRISQTKQIVEMRPDAHVVAGLPVSLTDVVAAEQILLNPAQRVSEELLHHGTERPPVAAAQRLARQAAAAMRADITPEPAVQNVGALAAWAIEVSAACSRADAGPGASFGALELNVGPPFGRSGEAC